MGEMILHGTEKKLRENMKKAYPAERRIKERSGALLLKVSLLLASRDDDDGRRWNGESLDVVLTKKRLSMFYTPSLFD